MAKKAAKKAADPTSEPEPAAKETTRKPVIVQMRGSDEWKVWVEELAEREGQSLTAIFERGVRELAERTGHRKPPRR